VNERDGGPAFPCELDGELPPNAEPEKLYAIPRVRERGMSLRDYFAAAAMRAPWFARALAETPMAADTTTIGQHTAAIAYAVADRMLAERTK